VGHGQWCGLAATEDGDDGAKHGPCRAGRWQHGMGTTALSVGCVGRVGGSRGWGRRRRAWGRLRVEQHEGRRRSRPAGDGDGGVEGRRARVRAVALGAKARRCGTKK
jgi:hypothetical protein